MAYGDDPRRSRENMTERYGRDAGRRRGWGGWDEDYDYGNAPGYGRERDDMPYGDYMPVGGFYGMPYFGLSVPYPGPGRDSRSREGYGYDGRREGGRDFWDRASDEVASWFGDEEAEARREQDEHRGKGPRGYTRSDSRIDEDVHDRLTDHPLLDASDITVTVSNGEVTLDGFVRARGDKRAAEDCADAVSGVKHVQNNLRVQGQSV